MSFLHTINNMTVAPKLFVCLLLVVCKRAHVTLLRCLRWCVCVCFFRTLINRAVYKGWSGFTTTVQLDACIEPLKDQANRLVVGFRKAMVNVGGIKVTFPHLRRFRYTTRTCGVVCVYVCVCSAFVLVCVVRFHRFLLFFFATYCCYTRECYVYLAFFCYFFAPRRHNLFDETISLDGWLQIQ